MNQPFHSLCYRRFNCLIKRTVEDSTENVQILFLHLDFQSTDRTCVNHGFWLYLVCLFYVCLSLQLRLISSLIQLELNALLSCKGSEHCDYNT